MKKSDFCKVATTILTIEDFFDKSFKLNIDLISSPVSDYYIISSILFETNYGIKGKEFLDWWFYERDTNKSTKEQLWDENGDPIDVDSILSLYQYMEDNYRNNC